MTSVTKSLQQAPIPAHVVVCAAVTPRQNRVDGELIGTEPKTEKSQRAIHLTSATEGVLESVQLPQKEERLEAGSRHGCRKSTSSPRSPASHVTRETRSPP